MNIKPIIGSLAITAIILTAANASAQCAAPPALFQLPLNQVPVPEPPNLFQFVKNKQAAIKLGKAFFWDMQVGSDGVQACGSCHFHAGADNRLKNTVNPGTRSAVPDTTFQVRGPNDTLLLSDFPFHLRQDPDFQASPVVRDSNDVVGSQGVHRTDFVSINPTSAVDNGTPVTDTVFSAGGVNMRRVTARNTPTNINAVFNFHNFWDGRAHYIFNGVNAFGPLETGAGVWCNVNAVPVIKKVA
jgi:cytochrome c peroxidase